VNARHCCEIKGPAGESARQQASWLRHGREIAGLIVPTAILALLPKCPACVVAYLALATGIGITLPTATYLRAFLVIVCVASLVFIAAKRLRGLAFGGHSSARGVRRIGQASIPGATENTANRRQRT
jgi:hypothetical protein